MSNHEGFEKHSKFLGGRVEGGFNECMDVGVDEVVGIGHVGEGGANNKAERCHVASFIKVAELNCAVRSHICDNVRRLPR